MIKTNIKIAIRHLLKNKAFSIINILGLSIGLSAFLLIYMYISFEKSYDGFFESNEHVYRVTTDNIKEGEITARHAITFAYMGPTLEERYPEVEAFTTTIKWAQINFKYDEQLYSEKKVIYADTNFLQIFPYEVIEGDPVNPLKDPNSVVLTKFLAEKIFKEENPIGKSLMFYSGIGLPYKVTAVIEDLPINTHYKFNMLLSLVTVKQMMDRNDWGIYQYYTYVKTTPGTDIEQLEEKTRPLLKEKVNENTTLVVNYQPVKDIHLYSDFDYEPEIHGNARILNFLIIIGIAILIIAWVNYINLSTAKSIDRAREVGMKKVVGAERRHLIMQFLMESMLINLFSIAISITIVQFSIPILNNFIGTHLNFWSNDIWILVIFLFVFSTLLSGFYPALVLSSHKPLSILRDNLWNSGKGIILRKVLVVFQFATSLVLIAGTFIVYSQISFMKNQKLGVDLNQVLTIEEPSVQGNSWQERAQKIETYHDELSKIPGVLKVASASNVPDGGRSDIFAFSAGVKIEGQEEDRSTYVLARLNPGFMETMGVSVIAGRDFMENSIADSSMAILNESARKKLGFASNEEALGKRFKLGSWPRTYTIIGVTNDFNRQSLKHTIEPTIFRVVWRGGGGYTLVKIHKDNVKETLESIIQDWPTYFPNSPFEYYFLDEQFNKAYQEDQRFGVFFILFSGLAIFIACLGLFGLSSFLALQKKKEIGIRKVLGASIRGIVMLMYKNFLVLVAAAFTIGLPVVYVVMENWLDNYTYRIDIPLWVFLVSGIALLTISFLTVAYQSFKAAHINPVDSLKRE